MSQKDQKDEDFQKSKGLVLVFPVDVLKKTVPFSTAQDGPPRTPDGKKATPGLEQRTSVESSASNATNTGEAVVSLLQGRSGLATGSRLT